ncbi:MAG TPA: NADH-quinone oxidoreductase subunit NuoF [Anaerolineae bacterium]|nr:NADH-quinone oxidoreductase subunit NuoF [Anaerolineae bacterium]
MKIRTLKDLERARERGLESLYPAKPRIMVGLATCGLATGAQEVFDALAEALKERGLDVVLVPSGCLGYCQREPIVYVLEPDKPPIIYAEMTAEKARQLIDALAEGRIVGEWALARVEEEEFLIEGRVKRYPPDGLPEEIKALPRYSEVPFWKKQRKIVLRNSGFINPASLEEYIARGGYFSLYKALTEFTPEKVIEEVSASGLRGRGGAGFPTGLKWRYCREAPGAPKYVICNADEGDPGAYMDRTVLEGDPHSVLEGMIIGAYAIGAREGYIYVRDEYPLAVKSLRRAVAQLEECGLLGEDILGSGFDFRITIVRGAGAFVCGEETALMASIEGRIGEPRPRPPFPATSGLWGKPTVINNVKTWASIPPIIARGAEWYAQMGTERSKGTVVFSLVGKINNTGLVEVPLGMTLREMIYDIGGGIPNGKAFKAVQTGGPSGGCIPAPLLDLPVDYETLTEAGSIMGSGGMVVMDEDACMVDVARYFLAFTVDESCGKCIPCREGLQQMYQILTDIVEGRGKEGHIELLEELAEAVKAGSLCALGGTAPNPVLTTIRYFRDEYEAHIRERRCPAGVCRALIRFTIDEERCTGCGICLRECPVQAISGKKKEVHRIDQAACIKCGVCREVCAFEAVIVE